MTKAKFNIVHIYGSADCAYLYAKNIALAKSGGKRHLSLNDKSTKEDVFRALATPSFMPISGCVFWGNLDKSQLPYLLNLKPVRNLIVHTVGKTKIKAKNFDISGMELGEPYDFFGKINTPYQEATFKACMDKAAEIDVQLDIQYFLKNIGYIYSVAMIEMEKFRYFGKPVISNEDIDKLCPSSNSGSLSTIFELATNGDKSSAVDKLIMLEKTADYSIEAASAYFYAMVRLAFIIRVFMDNNPKLDENGLVSFFVECGWPKKYHPYFMKMQMRSVSNRPSEHIAEMLKYIATGFGKKNSEVIVNFLARW